MNFLEHKILKVWQLLFCLRQYGLGNAARMTVRSASGRKPRTLHIRGHQGRIHPFTFRGGKDLGAVGHLWKEGYYIEDTPDAPVRTILDCGANIGVETLRFRLHHPEAHIVAVEADPENAAVLQGNFSTDPRTTVVEAGVWFEDTTLGIRRDPGGSPEGTSVTADTSGHIRIPAKCIPSILAPLNWPCIDILKLDIEGAEFDLFQHETPWLERVNALIFEVPDLDHPGTLQLMFDKLRPFEWTGSACGENLILIRRGLPWKARRVVGVNGRR